MEFEKSTKSHEAQFVKETEENAEDSEDNIARVLEEGCSVIDLNYRTRATTFLESSGKSIAVVLWIVSTIN